jgi:hypothetical protein
MTEGTETKNSIITKESLVGMWKLIEMKTIDKEQNIIYPYGKDAVSYITYTKEGYVSLGLMGKNRLPLGLPIENILDMGYGLKPKVNILKYIKAIFRYLQAAQQFVCYVGKYEVRDNQVFHNLEISVVPDVIGMDLPRTVEISGNQLSLNIFYPKYTVYSTWQRVS